MLLRRDANRVIAIPQPAHAAIAGQLAAAWGNEDFARPSNFADWCLAAAIHDIGWTDWEEAPTRDPASGWPHEFPQVSPRIHVNLWRQGVARARLFGRYPALIVSRHADTIYTRHVDRGGLEPATDATVAAFLEEQHALQRDLAESLAADPERREAATPEAIEHGRLALATVDELSLALCWGVGKTRGLIEVPREPGTTTTRLTLRPGPTSDSATLTPWPFGPDHITVRGDGRVLDAPSASDAELRERLARAPAATIVATLRPG